MVRKDRSEWGGMQVIRRNLQLLPAILAAGIIVLFWGRGVTGLDRWMLDEMTRQQLRSDIPDEIVIVDIDDKSLQLLGPWPWPRALIAALVHRIGMSDPQGVALDMVFPEETGTEGDLDLAKAVKESHVCIAQAFELKNQTKEGDGHHSGILREGELHGKGVRATGYIGNYPALAKAASCAGHTTPWLDQDGLLRRVPSYITFGNRSWPYLAAAMSDYHPHGRFTVVPYRFVHDAWHTVPAWMVLTAETASQLDLQGRWVLVGSTALGLGDAVATPIHPWLPGVVVHAELLSAILEPLPEPPVSPIKFTWLFAGLSLLILSVLVVRNQLRKAFLVAVVLAGIWLVLTWWLWLARVEFPAALPVGLIMIYLPLAVIAAWLNAVHHNRYLRALFSPYLAPQVVERLLASTHPDSVLEPQRRRITVMFADISGFTRLSQRMDTEELAVLTREILTLLTEQVHQHQGTVDKYIGDAVMAFWNAPLDQPDHADRAMACALDMISALDAWNAARTEHPSIRIRIALHTGEAMVGELGTDFRHTYTAIGATVNLADRLLSCAGNDAPIIVSPQLVAAWQRTYPESHYRVCDLQRDDRIADESSTEH